VNSLDHARCLADDGDASGAVSSASRTLADLIMRGLFETAENSGCSGVARTTDADNAGAQEFYERLGLSRHPSKLFYRAESPGNSRWLPVLGDPSISRQMTNLSILCRVAYPLDSWLRLSHVSTALGGIENGIRPYEQVSY
jgi:hypothetical protein